MSGIVGIVHLDQSPVDPSTLTRLTESLLFRGPDGQDSWVQGPAGFGHTLLSTEEARQVRQPFSLDGQTWIVADARLDARAELVAQLQPHCRENLTGAADAELLLHAYRHWGEACTEHLLGDFAFGIWDASAKRLFCARDQMGVKPFYYAHLGPVVIFSNTLDCIRQHPAVSSRLNDLAIADFLLLQINQDRASTAFADIQRLPAAHSATWSSTGKQIRCYWTMPVEEPLYLRREQDYVDRFHELLQQCVGDRLRTNVAGVFMSGGLDSTTMAAGAAKVRRARSPEPPNLHIVTLDDADNPVEKEYAGSVATALGVPIHFIPWGSNAIDYAWEQSPQTGPEPALNPWEWTALRNYYRQAGSYSRVFLHGEGPDHALILEWQPYVSHLLSQGRYGRLLRDLFVTAARRQHIPVPAKVSSGTPVAGPSQALPSVFPAWVDPALESRFHLKDRWASHWHTPPGTGSPHPVRPGSYASFQVPRWQSMFEWHDAGWTRAHVEVRHPFMDLRMLRFLLSVPVLPWCKQKYLLRRAMRGILPSKVLNRAKEGLTATSLIDRIVQHGLAEFKPVGELSAYVDVRKIPKNISADPWSLGGDLRVRALNNWLQHLNRS